MKYVEFINGLVRREILDKDNLVLYGQNMAAGSCLGGLTKNLSVNGKSRIINALNCENSLCGFGFGLMMDGSSGIFFMKQLDFLLLGLDHLVNTYNIIRNSNEHYGGSFTIVPIIMDNGYQGPQSSFNNFSDICSIARIKGYTITNKWDAEKIMASKMISPGFRIIGVSQRMFQTELLIPEKLIWSSPELEVFQYAEGSKATIVCFNFAFVEGHELYREMQKQGISASLFNVNSLTPADWGRIRDDVKRTKNLIVMDDSKSENLSLYSLLADLHGTELKNKFIIKRELSENWLNPVHDRLEVDMKNIIKILES